MRRRNDPSDPDEPPEEDERYQPDDSLFSYPPLPYGGRLPLYGNRAEDSEAPEDAYEGDASWWDEGLIALLVVAGVVLFLFPEPATSGVGVLLVGVGVVAWLVDWVT